jgi:hypothetical protein
MGGCTDASLRVDSFSGRLMERITVIPSRMKYIYTCTYATLGIFLSIRVFNITSLLKEMRLNFPSLYAFQTFTPDSVPPIAFELLKSYKPG